MAVALDFIAAAEARLGSYAGFGIASFGPVHVDPAAPEWGAIAQMPKPGWSGTDMVGPFASRFGWPVGFDTDVNGAILAESLWGPAADAAVATYTTIGTGIGGGAIIEGRLLHGARHPEMGHACPRLHPLDRDFPGTCRFHGNCLEGLASGPAIIARWGRPLSQLPADREAHDIIAYYLAQLILWQQALLSPQRIFVGGGVMQTPGLIERIRRAAGTLGAGYFNADAQNYDRLVTTSTLGEQNGLLGALGLATAARASNLS